MPKLCQRCNTTYAQGVINGLEVCKKCYDVLEKVEKMRPSGRSEYQKQVLESIYNEPEHYHKHKVDTIQFLQEGFPPEVFSNFCVANVVKYAQRYPYKNGRDDLVKLVDYAKRLLDWHDKTHS